MPDFQPNTQFLDKAINMYSKIVFVNDKEPKSPVIAFMRNDFNFTITSRYQEAFDQSGLTNLSNTVNSGVAVLQGVTSGVGLGSPGIANKQMKVMGLTVSNWVGTDKPAFSVSLLFVAYKPEISVVTEVKKLLKGVLPPGWGILSNFVLNAPLDYSPAGTSGASGTWTVRIGNWFVAPFQIITSVAPTFSKEVVQNGMPLYADVTVNFEPYRQLSEKEITSFFIQENAGVTSNFTTAAFYQDEKYVDQGGKLIR